MIKTVLLFTSLFYSVGLIDTAYAEPGRKVEPKSKGHSDQWYVCAKASDCIKGKAACSGVSAVNKKHIKEYDRYVKELSELISCLPKSPAEIKADKDSTIECREKRCTIIAPIVK